MPELDTSGADGGAKAGAADPVGQRRDRAGVGPHDCREEGVEALVHAPLLDTAAPPGRKGARDGAPCRPLSRLCYRRAPRERTCEPASCLRPEGGSSHATVTTLHVKQSAGIARRSPSRLPFAALIVTLSQGKQSDIIDVEGGGHPGAEFRLVDANGNQTCGAASFATRDS
jgi:hypothetical protein